MNKYYDSKGNAYSEATIKSRYSKFLRELYQGEPPQRCRGCGCRSEATAHIVPKSICKQLGLTELIWTEENTFPACHKCNGIAENVSSPEILKLRNIEEIKRVLLKYCPSRFNKIP